MGDSHVFPVFGDSARRLTQRVTTSQVQAKPFLILWQVLVILFKPSIAAFRINIQGFIRVREAWLGNSIF